MNEVRNEVMQAVGQALEGLSAGTKTTSDAIDVLIKVRDYFIAEEDAAARAAEAERKNRLAVAVASLSYSEQESIGHILDELAGDEGVLISGKIADRIGITRSVIVNALRKLESGGIIESRSLGMKGTRIKLVGYTNDEINRAVRRVA